MDNRITSLNFATVVEKPSTTAFKDISSRIYKYNVMYDWTRAEIRLSSLSLLTYFKGLYEW